MYIDGLLVSGTGLLMDGVILRASRAVERFGAWLWMAKSSSRESGLFNCAFRRGTEGAVGGNLFIEFAA